MGKFIVPNIKEVDDKIEKDIEEIKEILLKKYGDNIVSIILTGGFGRGEGGYIKKGENFTPFNDYDILMVTKKRVSKNKLSILSDDIAKKISIRFVDLGAIKKNRLSTIGNKIYSYDLKRSRVIYGEDKILGIIPEIYSESLPIEEAKKILLNRIICFFELTPDGFLEKESINKQDHRYFVLQVSKAVMAATIALLVKEKKYTSSYKDQLFAFNNIEKYKNYHFIVSKAYNLRLDIMEPEEINPWDFWKESRFFFLEVFNVIFKVESDWIGFVNKRSKMDYNFAYFKRRIFNFLRFIIYEEVTKKDKDKNNLENACILFLLSVNNDFSINYKYQKLAKEKLNKYEHKSLSKWKDIKNLVSFLWEEHHH